MARMRLIDLLSHPGNLDEKTLDSLREALDAYPFFQAGRMLWIKNLHKLDHIRYNGELKLAAAFIPDRSKLFFLINDVFSSLAVPDRNGLEEVVEKAKKNEESVPESKNEVEVRDDSVSSLSEENKNTENEDCLSENLDQIVGADANYFEVDDSFPSVTGEIIDFSIAGFKERKDAKDNLEEDTGNNPEENDVTIPSSELLDYEKEACSSYSLENDKTPSSSVLDLNESHSFSEWLKLLKNYSAASQDDQESETEKQQKGSKKSGKMELIDNFLNSAGRQKRIVPLKENSTINEDFSIRSVQESEDLMTETLANIHIKQTHYQKAIEIFERLSLKYPEKSVYFASRIKEMEDLINNQ